MSSQVLKCEETCFCKCRSVCVSIFFHLHEITSVFFILIFFNWFENVSVLLSVKLYSKYEIILKHVLRYHQTNKWLSVVQVVFNSSLSRTCKMTKRPFTHFYEAGGFDNRRNRVGILN